MDKIPDIKSTRLTDGRLSLVPCRQGDTEELYRAVRESLDELIPWMPWTHRGYAKKESRSWCKERPAAWKHGVSFDFIMRDNDGNFLGVCGLNDLDHAYGKANLGYWVRTSETGRGIATAITLLLAKWGFEVLRLSRIEICIAVENTRSLRVAEKAGAKREGILRNRLTIGNIKHDAVMHSLIPGEV